MTRHPLLSAKFSVIEEECLVRCVTESVVSVDPYGPDHSPVDGLQWDQWPYRKDIRVWE